ncbi:hypothetical protein HZC07_00230, partial [Candidatus Micrarchaeota archaeon]|nr:hypothetical protein [Candidatus Micrarchaeota archaeon]
MAPQRISSPARGLPEHAFFAQIGDRGGKLLTNIHNIEAREQSLKDTLFGIYNLYACRDGHTHNGTTIRNMSSGNFPNYFPHRIARVRTAMRAALEDEISGAYMLQVEETRARLSELTKFPRRHIFPCAGISDGIAMVHTVFLNRTDARVLIPNVTYPTHFATAITYGGRGMIVVVPRHPETGLPDFSRYSESDNPFGDVGFSSFI